MTSAQLRATLATLGWTTGGLARFLGADVDRVRNWYRPGYKIPDDVAAWLTRRVAFHRRMMEDDPPPGR